MRARLYLLDQAPEGVGVAGGGLVGVDAGDALGQVDLEPRLELAQTATGALHLLQPVEGQRAAVLVPGLVVQPREQQQVLPERIRAVADRARAPAAVCRQSLDARDGVVHDHKGKRAPGHKGTRAQGNKETTTHPSHTPGHP